VKGTARLHCRRCILEEDAGESNGDGMLLAPALEMKTLGTFSGLDQIYSVWSDCSKQHMECDKANLMMKAGKHTACG
jgi:hypothetical protein